MDISRLNPLNFLGLSKKTEKTEKPSSSPESDYKAEPVEGEQKPAGDSVSISLEALIKKTNMEAREEFGKVREDKVNEIKEKISSGTYQVTPEDLAHAILKGRVDVYQELK